jgi:uncharacterized phiE125 gp8 family phage protein
MGMRLVTAPAVEPVSLEQAKVHLRVDTADDDALIGMLISAARAHAENVCRRAFVTQQWDLFLDAFPLYSYSGVLPGYVPADQLPSGWMTTRNYAVRFRGGRIDLPFPTLQSVESVQYIDLGGVLQTLAPTQYVVDNVSEPGAITPAPGTYWPATQNVTNAVQIRHTAGYGDDTAVPPGLKAWILMRVGAMYENREEIVVGQRVASIDLPFVDRLLDPFRVWSYA